MESLSFKVPQFTQKDIKVLSFERMFSILEDLIDENDPRDSPNMKEKEFSKLLLPETAVSSGEF